MDKVEVIALSGLLGFFGFLGYLAWMAQQSSSSVAVSRRQQYVTPREVEEVEEEI